MIRLFSVEVALFVAPFIAYGVYVWAVHRGILHPEAWSVQALVVLSLAAIALTIGGFVVIAQNSGGPAYSTYVPAHIDNGKFIPGTLK